MTRAKRLRGMAQVIECLPTKCEGLSPKSQYFQETKQNKHRKKTQLFESPNNKRDLVIL
jgi:hypothetical protein